MSLMTLSALALHPLVEQLASGVADRAGDVPRVLLGFLGVRFRDPTRRLPRALRRSADRGWRALEIAVQGESLWTRLATRREERAFGAELRRFLDAGLVQLPPGRGITFRESVARELAQA